ncbi:pPIWI_RE_Z domain-containing protein [Spirosoma gilvum]
MTHTSRPRTETPAYTARPSLSTRQLVDLELGLFLLQQVNPTAPPTALPDLLQPDDQLRSTLTPRQQKYLNRGRLLLSHFTNYVHWQTLLQAYAASPGHRLAYDLSRDCSHFSEKTVGFSRNRLGVLRKMLA